MMIGKMMESAAPSSTGKRAARGQAQHSSMKGCSCKRSQCIKNYCDCYQSMAVCTNLCRCIGCRNTEERKAVNPTSSSKSSNAKRERAAALSAKAAAAAAKAGNIQVKSSVGTVPMKVGGNSVASIPIQKLPMPLPTAVPMINSGTKILPLQQRQNGTNEQSSTIANAPPCVMPEVADSVKPDPSKTSQSQTNQKESTGSKIFTRAVNAALLDCMMVQATEGEKLGLNEVQISQLVMHEFIRGLNNICRDAGIGNN